MPAAGLDLSDRSLKFVTFRQVHGQRRLHQFGQAEIPLDVMQSGEIKNKAALINILREVKAKWQLERVIIALPEEHAYIVRVPLPAASPSEQRESIELQLEEHVPLKASEVVFDYEPVAGKKNLAIVSVFPERLARDYEEVLLEAGLSPVASEIEAQAIAHAVVPDTERETVIVVDFGKTRTGFFVVREQQVLFSSTTRQLGGDIITLAISKNLNLPSDKAETLKLKQGLLGGSGQDELAMALVPVLSALRDEVSKIDNYWNRQLQDAGVDEGKIARLILCGGEAALPGLIEYLSGRLSLPVSLGQVWTNALDYRSAVPTIPFRQSLRYATAIGLALRSH